MRKTALPDLERSRVREMVTLMVSVLSAKFLQQFPYERSAGSIPTSASRLPSKRRDQKTLFL